MKSQATLTAILTFAASAAIYSQTSPATSVEARGVQLRPPAGWKCNERLIAAGGPIACTNFTGPYSGGGLLPAGGAEIEITSTARPINLADYARGELKGVPDLKLEEVASNGRPTLRVSYQDQVAPGISTKNIVHYVPQANRLYKFYLTFGSGDPREKELVATVETIVREAILK